MQIQSAKPTISGNPPNDTSQNRSEILNIETPTSVSTVSSSTQNILEVSHNHNDKPHPSLKETVKYVYVIGVICMGFLIAILTQISDPIDTFFEKQQKVILSFLLDDHIIYIILVLFSITALKAIGVKDVLGLRTISVVILSYRIIGETTDSNLRSMTLLLCMFIIGILSSVSKLVEYRVIGHELQVVLGTPVEYIFRYLRKILLLCIKERKLLWLDSKYTLKISEKSRSDKSMHVMANLKDVLDNYLMCNSDNFNESENGYNIFVLWRYFCRFFVWNLYFIIAVVWTMAVEWVQPITELFLFAHNWNLSVRNAAVVVVSEFVDFDKAVEAWYLIDGLHSLRTCDSCDGDMIDAKVSAVMSKGVFWALGYFVVLPPTLIWAYVYYNKHFENETRDKYTIDLQIGIASNTMDCKESNAKSPKA